MMDEIEGPNDESLGGTDSGMIVPGRGNPSLKNPLGKVAFDKKAFADYQAKPLESKREYLRGQWLDLIYLTLGRANSIALTVTKKDFGRLMQLATVAGISHDKVFPKGESGQVTNLVFNMFKGLPSDKVLKVIGSEPVPKGEVLDVTPIDTVT